MSVLDAAEISFPMKYSTFQCWNYLSPWCMSIRGSGKPWRHVPPNTPVTLSLFDDVCDLSTDSVCDWKLLQFWAKHTPHGLIKLCVTNKIMNCQLTVSNKTEMQYYKYILKNCWKINKEFSQWRTILTVQRENHGNPATVHDDKNMVQPVYYSPVHTRQKTMYYSHSYEGHSKSSTSSLITLYKMCNDWSL